MLVLQLGLVLVLLSACTFAPGFYFVRKLHWSPMEKLCGAAALSMIVLYLAVWGIYVAGMPAGAQPWAYATLSVVCVAMGVAAWRDLTALLRQSAVRRALAGFGFLLAWTLAILAIVRVYSGGPWYADWLEHFQRTLFVLHRFPPDTPLFTGGDFPERPIFMNVLAAFYLGQAGERFEIFQAVFAFLNLTMFLPCCLIVPAIAGRRRRVLPLTAVFALSPMFVQNVAYTWTKALSAFFVILALWLYLAAWRKRERTRMFAAFVSLAAGTLVHYSTGPFCVLLTLHYLTRLFLRRPSRWAEAASIGIACTVLLATWFAWSSVTFGARATIASNDMVTPVESRAGGILAHAAGNLRDSVVPAVWRGQAVFEQAYDPGRVRDWFFVLYQQNLIFGMGLAGGPMVVGLLAARFRAMWRRTEGRFWIACVPFCAVVGLVVAGERNPFGVSHLALLPLKALGLVWLAGMTAARLVALVLASGMALDFTMGILLQARVQSLENDETRTVFHEPRSSDLAGIGRAPEDWLNHAAWLNWFLKHQPKLVGDLIADLRWDPRRMNEWHPAMRGLYLADAVAWRGWYARHGGNVSYLGDHGLGTAATAALGAMFLGLIALFSHAAMAAGPRARPPREGEPHAAT